MSGRSAKHHVFERVREPGLPGRLVERAEAVPHRGLHDRRGVVLDDDDSAGRCAASSYRCRRRRGRSCARRGSRQTRDASASAATGSEKTFHSVVTPK